jgi:hypothetical protein
MTPLPLNPQALYMFLTSWSSMPSLARASRAKAALGIGTVSRGRASRANKPRGNAPPA